MIKCSNLSKSYLSGISRVEVLRDINMSVQRGERWGIVGKNGAGKSTLMKLISGVEQPTGGSIVRHMATSWPLGFSGGFQGSLTGYDNIRFISRIYGIDYNYAKDYVESFSELGSKLKHQVKTYSSGMKARLAFALSLSVDFECYLIDEIIMVGDGKFQEKCRRELAEIQKNKSLIIISHGVEILRDYCDKLVFLENGTIKASGSAEEVLDLYIKTLK